MKGSTVCIVLAALFTAATPINAQTEDLGRTVSVTGEGRASSPPDMAVVRTGVVVIRATATEALSANNEAMENMMKVLKDHGIEPRDIQTTAFDVTPEYKRDDRGRVHPEIVGYRVTNQVMVEIRGLADLGRVLDALVRAGGNQISGISFGTEDPADMLNQARKRAVADARGRAELYAQAAGVRVGKVLAISEGRVELPGPRDFAGRLMTESSRAVPVAPGEQDFLIRINMVFALEDSE